MLVRVGIMPRSAGKKRVNDARSGLLAGPVQYSILLNSHIIQVSSWTTAIEVGYFFVRQEP